MERAAPWTDGGAYEAFMGRWSRVVAARFVPWLGVRADARWLDVGCGTGALTREILATAEPAQVLGVDPSSAQVTHARALSADPRASFLAGGVEAVPGADGSWDAVVAGLVLNFVADPGASLARMAALARPGGVVAGYVWDYAAGMEVLRRFWDAAAELDPGAVDLDEGRRFSICHPMVLTDLFRSAGLHAVEGVAIEEEALFPSFAAYWEPFLGGQGPAAGYVAALDDRGRQALRARLEHDLGRGDRPFACRVRAWAVRGVR